MANFAIRNVHDSGKVHADSGPFSFKAEYEIDLSDAVVKIEKDNQAELGVTVYGAGKIKAKVFAISVASDPSANAKEPIRSFPRKIPGSDVVPLEERDA